MYYDMYDTRVCVDMCIHVCAGVPCVKTSRHTPVRVMSGWSMYIYTYMYYDMDDMCECMYIRMHNCATIRLMCLIYKWIVYIHQIYKAIYMYIYTQTHAYVFTYLYTYTHMYIPTRTKVYAYCMYMHTRTHMYMYYILYIYVQIRSHSHTNVHTYLFTCAQQFALCIWHVCICYFGYVSMHTYGYIDAQTHIHVFIYVHWHMYVHTHLCIYFTHMCTATRLRAILSHHSSRPWVLLCSCMYICAWICICATHICIYVYICALRLASEPCCHATLLDTMGAAIAWIYVYVYM